MKNLSRPFCSGLLSTLLFISFLSPAQTDSVIVTGRIRNLSARLYRESPTVLVSRNNILQASRELVRPAPLAVDGTFRVSLPLTYSQEEMYFNYGRISTAFLAAPGALTIDLDADSLFTAAVPFRFGGVNAQVNSQFARYKAFEAAFPDKPDGKKLTTQVASLSSERALEVLTKAYQAPFVAFSRKEKAFPLVSRWITSSNRYNAAAFLYDKAAYEAEKIPVSLTDSLRPANDNILTAARTSAMNRFASYATQRVMTESTNSRSNGLTVRALSILLERYGKNLTADERLRLSDYALANSAKSSDLKFFDGLIKRSPDTLQRLVNYETLIQRSIRQFDSLAVNYIAAYWLATSLPGLTLNFAELLYDYGRPQVKDPALAQSLDELYRLEVKDSTRIRAAIETLKKAGNTASSLEISPGVFVTKSTLAGGFSLFDKVVNANRGKVIYLLFFSPTDEAARQAAIDAQRLRNAYSSRDFSLVYLPLPGTDQSLWPEISTRYNLAGDHLLLTDNQLLDVVERLRSDNDLSGTVINRTGKIVKRNAPLPGAFDEVKKLIDKNL
ncbi:hypothetical protein [Spirosoma radiotolerans]|uniref:Thioredoxin domain-containing protein n=1 Tax=Spirosoma radiotolerans TaxID=1379870 RepID=A0A0E3ZZ30_9BACT|nr:hypothetical protein [Spirosoma radiotolerans]AKD57304.1 hypothetical protein SD10_22835 [Spirosoma radiotolerans]